MKRREHQAQGQAGTAEANGTPQTAHHQMPKSANHHRAGPILSIAGACGRAARLPATTTPLVLRVVSGRCSAVGRSFADSSLRTVGGFQRCQERDYRLGNGTRGSPGQVMPGASQQLQAGIR